MILNLVIYECVPTSNFPPGDRAQVRRQVWVVFLQQVGTARDGSVLTVQRLTGKGHGGSRCKCLVLPEAERCACVRACVFHPSLHPPSAPKRYHHHPPTPQVCPGRLLSQGPSAAPPSYSFFFFFSGPLSSRLCVGRAFVHSGQGPRLRPTIRRLVTTVLVLLGSCHRQGKAHSQLASAHLKQ